MQGLDLKTAKLIEVVDKIVDTLPAMALRGKDLYFYNGKFYEELSDFKLGQMILEFYIENNGATYYNPSKSDNIIKTLKLSRRIKETIFDEEGNKINVDNGVYDFDKKTLYPHDSKFFFTYCLDVVYDLNAPKPESFLKFLETTFTTKDTHGKIIQDAATIMNVIRIGGALIYPENKAKKLFMFLGEGSNGKSMLVYTFASFFPAKFITSLSLKIMSNEESFQRQQLVYARLNISGEEKGDKIDAEQIKRIVYGQDISIDRKNREPLNIVPRVKIVVDSNQMPYFSDTSHGMKRRLFMIEFKNKFVTEQDYKKEKDPESKNVFLRENDEVLRAKINSEKSGILNLFLMGLDELRETDWQFEDTDNSESTMSAYKEQSDNLGFWLETHIIVKELPKNSFYTSDDFIPIKEIASKFYEWYEENMPGRRCPYSTRLISRRIKEIFRIDGRTIAAKSSTTIGYPIQFL